MPVMDDKHFPGVCKVLVFNQSITWFQLQKSRPTYSQEIVVRDRAKPVNLATLVPAYTSTCATS